MSCAQSNAGNLPSSPLPKRVITLAHAVRSNRLIKKPKQSCSISYNSDDATTKTRCFSSEQAISNQIKQTLKSSGNHSKVNPTNSRLPMKMVMSTMATRKPLAVDNQDSLEKIDLANIRKYKLTPPSWLNKFHQKKKHQTSHLKKLISEVKAKQNQFIPISFDQQTNDFTFPKNQDCEDMKNLVFENDLMDRNVLSKPILGNNYEQMYNRHHVCRKQENSGGELCVDEDPLGAENIENVQTYNQSIDESFKLDLCQKRNPFSWEVYSPISNPSPQSDFVWNPVILSGDLSSKSPHLPINTPHKPVTNILEATHENFVSYSHNTTKKTYHTHSTSFVNNLLKPEISNWSPDTFGESLDSHHEPVHHSCSPQFPESYDIAQPSTSGSTSSSGNLESSSASSSHTVAEEHLRLTYYTRIPGFRCTPQDSCESCKRRNSSVFKLFEE